MSDSRRTFVVEKRFSWQGKVTDKVAAVMQMFGLDLERLKNNATCHKCRMELRPGDVCYITGPSGSGKSVLLRELYEATPESERINLNEIELAENKSLVDCIEGNFFEALRTLSKAGLNDVFCVLNQPSRLSDGQKYRFRLAKALASTTLRSSSLRSTSGKKPAGSKAGKIIFADEFCSNLDRITAAVVAYNVRKFAKRRKVTFVLAASGDDILCDLAPDVVVVTRLSGSTEVVYRDRRRQKSG